VVGVTGGMAGWDPFQRVVMSWYRARNVTKSVILLV
jgi:hypothetical protein